MVTVQVLGHLLAGFILYEPVLTLKKSLSIVNDGKLWLFFDLSLTISKTDATKKKRIPDGHKAFRTSVIKELNELVEQFSRNRSKPQRTKNCFN